MLGILLRDIYCLGTLYFPVWLEPVVRAGVCYVRRGVPHLYSYDEICIIRSEFKHKLKILRVKFSIYIMLCIIPFMLSSFRLANKLKGTTS